MKGNHNFAEHEIPFFFWSVEFWFTNKKGGKNDPIGSDDQGFMCLWAEPSLESQHSVIAWWRFSQWMLSYTEFVSHGSWTVSKRAVDAITCLFTDGHCGIASIYPAAIYNAFTSELFLIMLNIQKWEFYPSL